MYVGRKEVRRDIKRVGQIEGITHPANDFERKIFRFDFQSEGVRETFRF